MKKSCMAMFVGAAALVLLGTGCSSMNSSDSAKIADIGTKPVVYEVETSVRQQPVTGEASQSRLFWLLTWGDNDFADNAAFNASTVGNSPLDKVASTTPVGLLAGIFGGNVYDEVKKAASYNACKANNADALIAARYEVKCSNYLIFRRISCTVKGYPVTVDGIKNVAEKK